MSSISTGKLNYFGSSAITTATHTNSGTLTFVTPAQNDKGIVIYGFHVAMYNSGTVISLGFATSAPVNFSNMQTLGAAIRSTTTANNTSNFALPLYIPAGYGLYCFSENTNVNATIIYEVLL